MTCRLLVSQKAFPQRDVLSCAQDEHRTGQEAPPGQRRVQLWFFVSERWRKPNGPIQTLTARKVWLVMTKS